MVEFNLNDYIAGLEQAEEAGYPTYYSKGAKKRALNLSKYAEKGFTYLNKFFQTDQDMPLLVLDKEDWEKRLQLMYGAFNSDRGCLHFPADKRNPFTEAMQPIYQNCPDDLKKRLETVVNSNSSPFLTGLQQYFDGKIVHEMTHPLIRINRMEFGQRWITEFFCDYTNYAFLQSHKDIFNQILEVQKLMPYVLYEAAMPYAEYRRLEDFDNFWVQSPDGLRMIGSPLNLIWFYVKGMRGVIELYDAYGEDFITCVMEVDFSSNEGLIRRLESTHEGIGKWFAKWIEMNQ